MGRDDSVGDLHEGRFGKSGSLGIRRHLDRLLVVRNHRVDERLVEGNDSRPGRRTRIRAFTATPCDDQKRYEGKNGGECDGAGIHGVSSFEMGTSDGRHAGWNPRHTPYVGYRA